MRNATRFKIGFLRKIAEMGLLPSDFDDAAMRKDAGLLGFTKGLGALTLTGGRTGLAVGLGVPFLGGMAVGGAARAASRADDEDLEEVKNQELTSEYRRMAKEVRERIRRGRERQQPGFR